MIDPGDIIARRRFHVAGDPTQELIVAIGLPLRDVTGYYRCDYEIEGAGDCRVTHITGVDEVGALINALFMIGSWMVGVNTASYKGLLRWEGGGEDGDLGFPTIEGGWRRPDGG